MEHGILKRGYYMNKTKYVQAWINDDPLRKKYYYSGCPNGKDHLFAFKLLHVGSSTVKEVMCHDCGYTEK